MRGRGRPSTTRGAERISIPVIGYFFRTTKRDRERRNLLLLLTPHVIEGPDDFRAIFQRKLEEHREFVARFQQEGSELKLGLDFGKKHGLFEAMHQSLRKADDETKLLEELRRQEQRPPLPQELDGIEIPEPQLEVSPSSDSSTDTAPSGADSKTRSDDATGDAADARGDKAQ